MSPDRLRPSTAFLSLARTKVKEGIALAATLLLAMASVAQEPSATPPADSQGNTTLAAATGKATASVPAGTRIALVLTQPIQTRYVRRGDDIYAQTTSPVTAGKEVVIPPGTFVQGKFDGIEPHGGRGELRLQSLAITFPDGYVAPVSGPITLETDDGYAIKDPGNGRLAGALALPAAGAGIGALIGHFAGNSSPQTITSTLPPGCSGPPPGCLSSSLTTPGSTAKGTFIGAAVGGGIGAVASLAVLFRTHNFFLDAGSPISMVLHQPIVMPEDEVADAIRDAEEHPARVPLVAPRPEPPPPDTDPGIPPPIPPPLFP